MGSNNEHDDLQTEGDREAVMDPDRIFYRDIRNILPLAFEIEKKLFRVVKKGETTRRGLERYAAKNLTDYPKDELKILCKKIRDEKKLREKCFYFTSERHSDRRQEVAEKIFEKLYECRSALEEILVMFRTYSNNPEMVDSEEQKLRNIFKEEVEARNQLGSQLLRFSQSLANKYSMHIPDADRDQEAGIALLVATEGFDPKKSVRLITHSNWTIRNFMSGLLAQRASRKYIKLTQLTDDTEKGRNILETQYAIEHRQPDESLATEEEGDFIESMLSNLKERERRIIIMRCEGMTLRDIGHVFRISKERVRQIELRTKGKLAQAYEAFLEEERQANVPIQNGKKQKKLKKA